MERTIEKGKPFNDGLADERRPARPGRAADGRAVDWTILG
jgi:hypothetical protein